MANEMINVLSLDQMLRGALDRSGIKATVEFGEWPPECWILEPNDRKESFLIFPEEREGQPGYRVSRYVPASTGHQDGTELWDWDEWYQFYTSIDDLVTALKTGDYDQGRRAF